MAILPYNFRVEFDEKEQDIETSKTYKLDFKNGRIIGKVNGIEALQQAIYKIFQTERFKYLIYNPNYGIEKHDLMSANYTNELIESEFERVTKEALLEDERILEVKDFEFDFNSTTVYINFTVNSVFGKISINAEEVK